MNSLIQSGSDAYQEFSLLIYGWTNLKHKDLVELIPLAEEKASQLMDRELEKANNFLEAMRFCATNETGE